MARQKTLTRRTLMKGAVAAGAASSLHSLSTAGEAVAKAPAARPQVAATCHEAGFHSTTTYNVTSTGRTSSNLTQEYEDLIGAHANLWKAMTQTPLPHCPVITMGWDVTPRCEHQIPWPFAKPNYPYCPVIVGNTPEQFGRLCNMAADAVAADPKRPFAVFVNAWNEWTEGSYLLPEEKHGTAYLKALARAFPTHA